MNNNNIKRKLTRRKIAKKSRNNNNNNVITRNFLSRPNPSLPKTSAVNSPYSSSQSSTTKSSLPKRPKGSKRRGRGISNNRKNRIHNPSSVQQRRLLNDNELCVAKKVVETFLNKIGIDKFYDIDVYEFCKADSEGLVSLSDLQSSLSKHEVYCSMPFLKLLKSVIFGAAGDIALDAILFDCGQLINVVNQLDTLQDETISILQQIGQNEDDGNDFDINFEAMLKTFAQETEDRRKQMDKKIPKNNQPFITKPAASRQTISPITVKKNFIRPTSPILSDAINLTSDDSALLQQMLNNFILQRQQKEMLLKELKIQLHILQSAEKEHVSLNNKRKRLQYLKGEYEKYTDLLEWERRNEKIRKHMITRTHAANKIKEKSMRNTREVIKHYNNADVLQQLQKAEQELYKIKKQLSNCQKKVYSMIDAQNDRLKERLEELQDALVVRKMNKISEQRREDIANGVYFDTEKLQTKLRNFDATKARLLLNKKWDYHQGVINKLFNVTGTYELESMMSKVLNQQNESKRLEREKSDLKEKISSLEKKKLMWKEYYDSMRFGTESDIEDKHPIRRKRTKKSKKQKKNTDVVQESDQAKNDDNVMPAGINYEVRIEEVANKIRKEENRSEKASVKYTKLRQIVAEMTMRIQSMMLSFEVNTKEVDVLLKSIETDSDFSQHGQYLAEEVVEGLEKSIFALNKIAEKKVKASANEEELFLMMMNEFESENIGEENATVKNPVTEIKPAIDADNVLNQVEKLKIIDQHNSDSVQQKNILKKKHIGIISVKDLHMSARQEMIKNSPNITQRQANKTNNNHHQRNTVSQIGSVGTSIVDYISLLRLAPDLNYMKLEAPLGQNIRVTSTVVDQINVKARHAVVFTLIRNINGLLKKRKITASILFRKIDKDESGSISKSELWDGLRELGIKWRKTDFDLLYERFDSDGDDSINIDEFLRIIDPDHKEVLVLEKLTIDDVVIIKNQEHKKIHQKVIHQTKKKIRSTLNKEEWLEETKDYNIKTLRNEIKLKSAKRVRKEMKKIEKENALLHW